MNDMPPKTEAGSLAEGTPGQKEQHRPSQAATNTHRVPPQPAGVAPQPPPQPQQQQQQHHHHHHQQQQQSQPAPLTPPSTSPVRSSGAIDSTSQRRSPTTQAAAAAAAAAVKSTAPPLPQPKVTTDKDDREGSESFVAAPAAVVATSATAAAPDVVAYAPPPPTHEYNISGALIPVSPPVGARARTGAGAEVGGGDPDEPRDDGTANFYEWRDVFPELEALAMGLPEITAECLQVASWKAWPEKHYEEGGGQDWKVFPFVHTFPAYDESRRTWVESSCKRCPETAAILRRLPNIRTALFSRLGGGSRISGHRGWADLANHVLRCHLPIKVPSDGVCGLWVESEFRRHDEGEIVVFDDSKLHRAFNGCTEERLVLIVDLLRPPGVPLGTADGEHTPELDAFIEAFR